MIMMIIMLTNILVVIQLLILNSINGVDGSYICVTCTFQKIRNSSSSTRTLTTTINHNNIFIRSSSCRNNRYRMMALQLSSSNRPSPLQQPELVKSRRDMMRSSVSIDLFATAMNTITAAATTATISLLSIEPAAASNGNDSIINNNSDSYSVSSIGMLSKETTIIVFIIGVIPFIIATYEFWRRIAVGATFGTGSDSVVFPSTTATIGEDNDPSSSRGKQILGQDSLITAYIIFATVAVVLGLVFYSVITSPIPL